MPIVKELHLICQLSGQGFTRHELEVVEYISEFIVLLRLFDHFLNYFIEMQLLLGLNAEEEIF
jgi:hypothetical protein